MLLILVGFFFFFNYVSHRRLSHFPPFVDYRAENLLQAYSFGGSNLCTAHSQYFQPILPDQFGQQYVQWFGLVDSASMHDHQIGQQAWPNHNMAYSDFFHQSYGAEQWHVLGKMLRDRAS